MSPEVIYPDYVSTGQAFHREYPKQQEQKQPRIPTQAKPLPQSLYPLSLQNSFEVEHALYLSSTASSNHQQVALNSGAGGDCFTSSRLTELPLDPGTDSELECLPPGQLSVKVAAARHIKAKTPMLNRALNKLRSGSRNISVLIKIRGESRTTKGHPGGTTRCPTWNQTLSLPVKRPDMSMKPEDSELVILIYNKKAADNSGDILGGLSFQNLGRWVNRSGNKATVSEQWYPVYLEGKREGQILLRLEFTRTNESGDESSANSVTWDRVGSSHHNDSLNVFNSVVRVCSVGNMLAAAQVALAVAALAVTVVL